MKSRIVLLAIACVSLSVIAWLALPPPKAAFDAEPFAKPATETAAIVEAPLTSGREIVTPAELPSEPAAATEVADATPPVVSEIDAANALYGAKYRNASIADLVVARYDLEKRRNTDRDRIIKEILDRGELDVLKPGEAVGTKPGGPPVFSFVSTWTPALDASVVIQSKTIEPEKYPEFHALEMETWWLDSEVRHREKLAREGK